jgi:hypothetical protein
MSCGNEDHADVGACSVADARECATWSSGGRLRPRRPLLMDAYVFILSPQFSGSTVLWQMLASSRAVSALPREGQFIEEVKDLMRTDPWNEAVELPWHEIKGHWDRYWDRGRTYLLEKSPPNMIRAKAIERVFEPARFVLLVRNPYAHAEGLMRRNGSSAREAAEFSLMCLRKQIENRRELAHSMSVTYEDLVTRPEQVAGELERFLPGLGPLDVAQEFEVHSVDGRDRRKLTDFNERKIDRLSVTDIGSINDVFGRDPETLGFWGYRLYQPTAAHRLRHARSGVLDLVARNRQRVRGYLRTAAGWWRR